MRPAVTLWLFPPVFVLAALLASAWLSQETMFAIAWAPIAIPLVGYAYFPWAVAKLRLFSSLTALKSTALGLIGYELYRQVAISAYKTLGFSSTDAVQARCGVAVESLGVFVQCGAVTLLTLVLLSAVLLFAPAALLAAFKKSSQGGASEA